MSRKAFRTALLALFAIVLSSCASGSAGGSDTEVSSAETSSGTFAGTVSDAGVGAEEATVAAEEDYPIIRDVFLLDTFCEITINAGGGTEAMDSAIALLSRLDGIFDKSNESSDIYRINHRDSDRVEISEEAAGCLSFAKEFSLESGGVMEPAIEPLTSFWNVKERTTVPDPDDVSDALRKVRPDAFEIDGTTFIALDEDVRIDVGSFAKGYIADLVKADMLSHGATSAIINLGGNVLCLGRRVDGDPFKVAIREPGKSVSDFSHVLEIDDDSVVTAGIYERYFEADDHIYHHIIDVSTGYPADNELESVTIVGHESAVCDALCTSIFIMGTDAGSDFLTSYNAAHGTDYYAIFIRRDEV